MDSNEKEDLKVVSAMASGAGLAILAIICLAFGDFGNAFMFTCLGAIPAIYLIYKLFPL